MARSFSRLARYSRRATTMSAARCRRAADVKGTSAAGTAAGIQMARTQAATRKAGRRQDVTRLTSGPGWMGPHDLFVDLGAPARSRGQVEVAVLHVRLHGDELVVPWHLIRIRLHDAQIGHHGAEVPAHHGGERPVEIVRR